MNDKLEEAIQDQEDAHNRTIDRMENNHFHEMKKLDDKIDYWRQKYHESQQELCELRNKVDPEPDDRYLSGNWRFDSYSPRQYKNVSLIKGLNIWDVAQDLKEKLSLYDKGISFVIRDTDLENNAVDCEVIEFSYNPRVYRSIGRLYCLLDWEV